MTLTAAEKAALDALFEPDNTTIYTALADLGVNPAGYIEAIDAQREFAEYLLAVAIQDLWIAGSLAHGQEVVNIARKYWPMPANTNEETAP